MSRPVPHPEPPAECRSVRSARPADRPRNAHRHAQFALDRRTPAASREFVRVALSATGRAFPRPVVDDVMIVVAELVTDSYLAGAGTVEVGVDVGHDDLAVTVRDDRPEAWPRGGRVNQTREMLLDALTVHRSSFADGGGVVHLARLPVPPP